METFIDEIGYTEINKGEISIEIEDEINFTDFLNKVIHMAQKYNIQDKDIILRNYNCGCGGLSIEYNNGEGVKNE